MSVIDCLLLNILRVSHKFELPPQSTYLHIRIAHFPFTFLALILGHPARLRPLKGARVVVEGLEHPAVAAVEVDPGDAHGEVGVVAVQIVGYAKHDLDVLGLVLRVELELVRQHTANPG